MKKITALKLTAIHLVSLRSHEDQKPIQLGDMTYISGQNHAGKTTIAHGVAFALYGVTFFGESKIDWLMNEKGQSAEVRLSFADQDGQEHTLIRQRKGSKTTLMLDGYTIRQRDIDAMLCDKETFLSMFNPLYLPKVLKEDGRRLFTENLDPVPKEAVLAELSEAFRTALDGVDFDSPEAAIIGNNGRIKEAELKITMLEGNAESIREAAASREEQLGSFEKVLLETEDAVKALRSKQYEGIDLEAVDMQLAMLKTAVPNADREKAAKLEQQIIEAKNRRYQSKYQSALNQVIQEQSVAKLQIEKLRERYAALKPGVRCPTCYVTLTAETLAAAQQEIQKEAQAVKGRYQELQSQKAELCEYMQKEKAAFEQFVKEDVEKLARELRELKPQPGTDPRAEIDRLEEIRQYGNLSQDELVELSTLEANLAGVKAQIKALKQLPGKEQLVNIANEKARLESEIIRWRNANAGLGEFIARRTQLATAHLQMPNVKIQLERLVKSTGELKNVFEFTYHGRVFGALSTSEEILAGIEIAAMVRRLTGIDCPLCIDNAECIGSFQNAPMPGQVLLIKHLAGKPLSVVCKNNTASPVMKKAG